MMYAKEDFTRDCLKLFGETEGNIVDIPGIGSTVLYEEPLIGFAAASDEIFEAYRRKEVIGPCFFGPTEWLPAAQTVVSFFFPFSETVRESNRTDRTEPSTEWLYARIEGQAFLSGFMAALKEMLEGKGFAVCVPGLDPRFETSYEMVMAGGEEDLHVDSRWSERHAAFACGLGTFGLSRGLITEKGMAGRYASLIVSETWEPTGRGYTEIDEYCVKCGACLRRCPVQAISMEAGKNNKRCKAYVHGMEEKYSPRYGCGKCQVGVPCEHRAPGLRRNR